MMEITGSYPAPTQANISNDCWSFFQKLPSSYRKFLLSYNGGFVSEFQYTFLTGVPFKTEEVYNPSRDDCVVEFFGIPTSGDECEGPKDLLQTAIDYKAEHFLPNNIIAIARCIEDSLICISLRESDYGQVYYWDYSWQYPWCKYFFEQRINEVRRLYPNAQEIANTPDHPDMQRMMDDFNYATIVRLADDFDEWIESCTDKSNHMEE